MNVPAGIKTNSIPNELRKAFSEAGTGGSTKMNATTTMENRRNNFVGFFNMFDPYPLNITRSWPVDSGHPGRIEYKFYGNDASSFVPVIPTNDLPQRNEAITYDNN